MKRCLLFSFFIFTSAFAFAQLRINEIMSNNVSAVMDPYYNYRMWVELYNMGETEEDLSAYYFTDDLSQPKQWKPLSKKIPSKGFSVLWFEREGSENEDRIEINLDDLSGYSTFKLDPDGGTLYLLDESGNIIDLVTYPNQYRNVSYGRLIDGENDWVFFVEYSNGASNNGRKYASIICRDPIFVMDGGFFQGSVNISFKYPALDETIYYTTDGSEPNSNSIPYIADEIIVLTETTCVRAISIGEYKIPSNIVTTTYFVNERNFNLPVVSIVTEQKNLFDDMIGIYVIGSNGISHCGVNANFNRDWFRPANFEFFDTLKRQVLSQELDIRIFGNCSRVYVSKSLKIKPRKKFGDNHLRYDFFSAQKPNRSYKDIILRNSGGDFLESMIRCGFHQTLITGRMDIDHQAYEPSVVFINGEYYGILNLREVSASDHLYSNYGFSEDDFYLLTINEIFRHPEFVYFLNFVEQNDLSDPNVYKQVENMIDIDSFAEYMLTQIYINNTDWPHNNFKVWKNKQNGKWRWILYDTDMGFYYYTHERLRPDHNMFDYLDARMSTSNRGFISIYHRLMLSDDFRDKMLHKLCVHISSTFAPIRVDSIMDRLISRISTEIVYHKHRWGQYNNFDQSTSRMKEFSANRPDYVYQQMGERFFPTTETQIIKISSNISKAKYQFFTEAIIDNKIDLRYFKDQPVVITPDKVAGYQFKHWEYKEEGDEEIQILTEPVYTGILSQNISLKAIYEKVDDSTLKIYINEISGNDKWLEIYNAENEPVHLTGFTINVMDNEGDFFSWTVPPGTIIDAKGFKVFPLGMTARKDVAFKLFDDEGREIDFFEVKMLDNLYSLGDHRTVGRQTDGNPNLIVFLNGGTKGYSNNEGTPEACEVGAGKRIFINEISGNDKWIELYNDEDETVDLTAYTIRKIDDVNAVNDWTIPAGTNIAAKGFKTWTQDMDDGFTWGITAQRDISFKLFDDKGRELDFFEVRMSNDLYSDGDRRTVGRQTDGDPNLIIFLNGGTKNYSNKWGVSEIPLPVEDIFVNLKIYPNPFRGEVHLVGAEGCMLQVFTASGALVHIQRIINPDEIIRMDHLPAGMYLFRVEKNGKAKTVRAIKN